MIGATVRCDDEIGGERGYDGLDENMHLGAFTLAARRVADNPPNCVTGRNGHQPFARLERDVGDLVDGGVELVERAGGVGVNLDGVDEARLARLDLGSAMRCADALTGSRLRSDDIALR